MTHLGCGGGEVFERWLNLKTIHQSEADLHKNWIYQIEAAKFGLRSEQMSDGRSVHGSRTARIWDPGNG